MSRSRNRSWSSGSSPSSSHKLLLNIRLTLMTAIVVSSGGYQLTVSSEQ